VEKNQKAKLYQLVQSDGWEIVTKILNEKITQEQEKMMKAENFEKVLEARAKITAYEELLRLDYYKK